jgi:hypothetical protein
MKILKEKCLKIISKSNQYNKNLKNFYLKRIKIVIVETKLNSFHILKDIVNFVLGVVKQNLGKQIGQMK